MNKYDAVLDIRKRIVTVDVKGVVVSLKLIDMPERAYVFNVHVPNDVIVNERSQVVFAAQVHVPKGAQDVNTTGLFSPSSQVSEKYNLLAANVLASIIDGQIFVLLANATKEPTLLKQGTLLGTFECLSEDTVSDGGANEDSDTSVSVSSIGGVHVDKSSGSNVVNATDDVTYNRPVDESFDDFAAIEYSKDPLLDTADPKSGKLMSMDKVDIGYSDITAEQKAQLMKLLHEHERAFSKHKRDRGRTHLVRFSIDTGDAPPVRSGLRRMSPPQRAIVEKHVNEMLEDGVIEPSNGEYSSPIVLVKKKNGELRFCVDYRRLNAQTVKDAYPLPRIDDAIDTLHNAKYFSTLDLQGAYWQVPIELGY
jgi:hypothetical protein